VYATLEQDLDLLGVTAVEDRLQVQQPATKRVPVMPLHLLAFQDGVAETMIALRAAGMRLWVLTGKLSSSLALRVSLLLHCGNAVPTSAFAFQAIRCKLPSTSACLLGTLPSEPNASPWSTSRQSKRAATSWHKYYPRQEMY